MLIMTLYTQFLFWENFKNGGGGEENREENNFEMLLHVSSIMVFVLNKVIFFPSLRFLLTPV